MMVGMVDDRAMRFRQQVMPPVSRRQPRPTPQPVAPTRNSRLNEVARVAMGMNPFTGTSQADRDASTGFIQRHGAMDALLAPASSLVEDFADAGYAPSTAAGRFGLGAAAFGADVLNPVGWAAGAPIDKAIDTGIAIKRGVDALGEIGVRGPSAFAMSAADPAGAQAARNLPRFESSLMQMQNRGFVHPIGGLNIPIEDSSGMNAAILRYLGRHRSREPLLGLGVQHPADVPINTGRAAAGGTYFGASRETSDAGFSGFGNEVYRIQEPLWNVWNTVRNSPGYITPGALQRRMPANVDLNAAEALSLGPATAWDDPLMQQLRDEGYLGYRYADDAFTDWTVGARPFVGLSKESGSSTVGALANQLKLDEVAQGAREVLNVPVEATRNLLSNIRGRVGGAQQASQNAYQNALREYQESERNRLAQEFGSLYNTNPSLLPPAPPGYTPAGPPPSEPGVLDFLQYLFQNQ